MRIHRSCRPTLRAPAACRSRRTTTTPISTTFHTNRSEMTWFFRAAGVLASASMTGAFIIILSYLLTPSLKRHPINLVFYLAIADFFFNMKWVITSVIQGACATPIRSRAVQHNTCEQPKKKVFPCCLCSLTHASVFVVLRRTRRFVIRARVAESTTIQEYPPACMLQAVWGQFWSMGSVAWNGVCARARASCVVIRFLFLFLHCRRRRRRRRRAAIQALLRTI